ncbi:carbon-nitrogen hydrolase family protein [Ornithinimicrobium sp. F0845]|uniref:carbon-nitrogen hydrolase family protein n=1 Tax=Ornithinimicrobium sp. F0845 TaxID=2926412 RepID=UPI001FF1EF4C|nr:carbon-nitrogen hydrolase family protein [Ornithinimicrobium sp. F0845]MCK0113606.1 carbon-nitrogen hydrolase family protein [Ornithinimicrobium sp. F0845]
MTRVAVVQDGSVPFDAAATTAKVVALIDSAAQQGAQVVVFPEAFLGTYPKGLTFGAPVGARTQDGREEFLRYAEGAVRLDGPEVAEIVEAARGAGVFVVLGLIERAGGTLYCTVALIDADQGLVGHHRKLMPTAAERLVWGQGDGSTLPVVDSPAGRVGAVICWENYMPLLRTAMYAQGIELYCAPTVDDRDAWQHTMRHIALEGRCFVLAACQYIRRSDYPEDYATAIDVRGEEPLIRGGSVIVDPLGQVLAGPLFGEPGILVADLDLADRTRSHLDLDVVGHYARPDVFRLQVDDRPREPVTFASEG